MERVERALDEHVRPALRSHSGNVLVEGFYDGELQVRLTGRCADCMSADVTNKLLIETVLVREIPEIKSVILVSRVSPDLMRQALEILNRNRESR